MKLKLSKCIFGRTEVKYLGHIISHNQLKPDPGKVKSIQDFPRPDTVKKVRQFMGLANYYRIFVKDFSKISFPLVRLTRKNQPFIWNEEVEESFAKLKMALSTKPLLAIYNPDYPSKVYTDASKYGIGAILTQIGPDNEEHVIAYYSKTLQPHQENYSAYEMECLAVIQATDHFHVYIENQPFEIITEHAALQWLFTMKKPKYFRWILSLSSKSCNIVHRSGKQQTHVDALSRLPVVNIATQELQEHQQNSDLSFLKNSHTHDGVVMIKQKGVFKAVVPNSLTKKILEEYHDSLSHPSITKTCKLITQCYWWKGITTDIKNYVRSCKSCQQVKVRHEPTLGEMITPTSNIQPLQMIGCDTIVLGTAAANTKHKFIQVFVDHATRYLWAYPTITNTAQAVTQCLDKIIKSVNSINTILTDNGKNFISKEFNKFLSLQGIKHTYTSPYHPQCNGICEKLNDTIMTKLRIAVLEKPRCKWSSLLPQVVKNYNSTPHDVTGFSPLFLMYGIGNVPEFADQTPITIEEARKKASLRTEQIRSKWKIKHDSHHPKYVFKEGDLVIRKIAFNDPRLIKTSPKYEGPFVIQKNISDVTYDISLKDQKQARRKMKRAIRSRAVQRTTISKLIKRAEAELDEETPSENVIITSYKLLEKYMADLQDEDKLIWNLMLDDEENDDKVLEEEKDTVIHYYGKWIDLETKINHFLNSLMKNTEALHGASSEKGSLPGTRVCRLPKLDLKICDGSSLEFRMSEKPRVVGVTLMKGVDPASIKEDAGIVVSPEQMVEETSTQIAVEESEKAQVEKKHFAEESKNAQVEKRSVVEVDESHRAEVKKESVEADEEKGLDVEQGMDSKNTEEVKLLYAEQGTDSKVAEGLDAEQGTDSKVAEKQDADLENGEDSEAETKDNGVRDSKTAIKGYESVSNSKAVAEGADQVEISNGETESIDDIEERVVRVPSSRKLVEARQTGDAEFKITYVKREPIEKSSIGKYLPNNKMQLVSKETVSGAVITPILYTSASSPKRQVPIPEKNLNLGDKSPESSGKSAKLERIANPVDYRNIILSGLRSLKKISESYDFSKPSDDASASDPDSSKGKARGSQEVPEIAVEDSDEKSAIEDSKPSEPLDVEGSEVGGSSDVEVRAQTKSPKAISSKIPCMKKEESSIDLEEEDTGRNEPSPASITFKALEPADTKEIDQIISLEKTSATTTSEMLSFIAKLEDPLRWLAPVLVTGKIMVQRLWITELHWDDPMDDSLIETLNNIRKELNFIGSLRIPRCVRLLASKTKLAPMRKMSIPRLELCAALLLTRLHQGQIELLSVHALSETPFLVAIGEMSSTFNGYIRKLAWILRFCHNCRYSAERYQSHLTPAELRNVHRRILRAIQCQHFREEIRSLTTLGSVKRTSKIYGLTPFLDDQGILGVGGRLSWAPSMTYEQKHPALLPSSGKVAQMIVKAVHMRTLHGSVHLMLSTLRQKYWTLRVKDQVKRCIRECVTCCRYNRVTPGQLMSDLPKERLTPGKPFSISGVDHAGPVNLRLSKGRGRKTEKGYICLFVCFVTRAVHLELVTDASTPTFMSAFKRFVARRGPCTRLYNDQGVVTPAHFLLAEPSSCVPEDDLLLVENHLLTRWQLVQRVMQHLWKRWSKDYLNGLQQRNKWKTFSPNVDINTIIVMATTKIGAASSIPSESSSDVHESPKSPSPSQALKAISTHLPNEAIISENMQKTKHYFSPEDRKKFDEERKATYESRSKFIKSTVQFESIPNASAEDHLIGIANIIGYKNIHSVGKMNGQAIVSVANNEQAQKLIDSGFKVKDITVFPCPLFKPAKKYILSGVLAFIQDQDLKIALEPYGQMISSRPLPFPTDNPLLKHLSSLRREIVFKTKEKTPMPATLNVPYMDKNFTIFIGEDVVCNGCRRHGHVKNKCPFDPNIRATVTRTFAEALNPSKSPVLPSETPKEAREPTQRPSETPSKKLPLTASSEEENCQKDKNDLVEKSRPDPQSGLTAAPSHDEMEKDISSVLGKELNEEKTLNAAQFLAGLPGPSTENPTSEDEDNMSTSKSDGSVTSSQLQKQLVECETMPNPDLEEAIATIFKRTGQAKRIKIQEQIEKHPDLLHQISLHLEVLLEDDKNTVNMKSDDRKILRERIRKAKTILNTMKAD
ncbi:K02A2.6-like [Cordylochernes scorpioides]|uniref:RNA-directed DNA polymerase n=1 Tax=Cordylochernes scorpioides TaxID=51811 RepID=A0ABY6JX67_9ARAC|nr:K02A2.6-like [Cordylochernes scorpioides]